MKKAHRVIVRDPAREDIKAASQYLAQYSVPASKALRADIQLTKNRLRDFPELYAKSRHPVLEEFGYRVAVLKYGYLMFYTIDGDDVVIHKVESGKRDFSGHSEGEPH